MACLSQEWPKLVGFPDLKAVALAPATHSLEEEPHPVPAKFSGEPLAVDSAKKSIFQIIPVHHLTSA